MQSVKLTQLQRDWTFEGSIWYRIDAERGKLRGCVIVIGKQVHWYVERVRRQGGPLFGNETLYKGCVTQLAVGMKTVIQTIRKEERRGEAR